MLNEKFSIPVAILVLAVLFSFGSWSALPKYIGIFALVILASVFAKKLAGHFLEVDVETEIWDFRRYWFAERHKLKNPVPLGILIPLFIYMFSYGAFKWLAVLQTEFKSKITKKIRKRKPWSFPEMREIDVALICFSGILSSIVIALVAFAFSKEISLISLLYAFFNLLPIGKLDGTRLFFSSRIIYFISILALAGASIILAILQI